MASIVSDIIGLGFGDLGLELKTLQVLEISNTAVPVIHWRWTKHTEENYCLVALKEKALPVHKQRLLLCVSGWAHWIGCSYFLLRYSLAATSSTWS